MGSDDTNVELRRIDVNDAINGWRRHFEQSLVRGRRTRRQLVSL